jgi:very-short-patch-repair endonuclease
MDEAAAILGNGRTRPAGGTLSGGLEGGVWGLSADIHRKLPTPPADHLIAELAARQHGPVSGRQLVALGLGEGAIAWRVRTGRLHRIHRGVYAVGQPVLPRYGQLMAAVLACGDGAVLSHRSAAELLRLGPTTAFFEVTAPGDRRPPDILVHRAEVPPEHRGTVEGIPVTSPARTLIDLADVLTRRGLERAIDEAEYLRLDHTGLRPIAGRRGAGVLAVVLDRHTAGSTRTRSELEEIFLALCGTHFLTQPETNAQVGGFEVDFVWREPRLLVELDGRAAHHTLRAFEADRARDAELTASGYRVMRFTQRRLEREPAVVADELRRAGVPAGPGRPLRSRAGRRRRPRP